MDVATNARDIRRTIAAIPSDDELCVTRARSHTFITAASLGDNAPRRVKAQRTAARHDSSCVPLNLPQREQKKNKKHNARVYISRA